MTTNDKETTEHIKLNCLFPMQYAKQCKIKPLLLCYDHGKILKSTTRYNHTINAAAIKTSKPQNHKYGHDR